MCRCNGSGVVVSEVYLGASTEEPCECVEKPSSPTRLAALSAQHWALVERSLSPLRYESAVDRVHVYRRIAEALQAEIAKDTGETDPILELLKPMEDLEALAESAMRAANRDGAEYDVEAELREVRVAIAKARGR